MSESNKNPSSSSAEKPAAKPKWTAQQAKLLESPEGRRQLLERAHGGDFTSDAQSDSVDQATRDRNIRAFFNSMSREDVATFLEAAKGGAGARTEVQKRYRGVAAQNARATRLAAAADNLGRLPVEQSSTPAPATSESSVPAPEAPKKTGRHRAEDPDNDAETHQSATPATKSIEESPIPTDGTARSRGENVDTNPVSDPARTMGAAERARRAARPAGPTPAEVRLREALAREEIADENRQGSNYFDDDYLYDPVSPSAAVADDDRGYGSPTRSDIGAYYPSFERAATPDSAPADDDILPDPDTLRGGDGDRRGAARRRRGTHRRHDVGAPSPFDVQDTVSRPLAGLADPHGSGEFDGNDAITEEFPAVPRSPRSRGFWRRVGDFARSASSFDRAAGRSLKAAGEVANGFVGLGIVAGFQKLSSRSEKWRKKFDEMSDDERKKYERRVGLWSNIGAIAAGTYFLVTKTHLTDSMPWVSDMTGHGHNSTSDSDRLVDATQPPRENGNGNGVPAPATSEVPAPPHRRGFGLFRGYQLAPDEGEEGPDHAAGGADYLVDFNVEDTSTREGKGRINDFNAPIPLADSGDEKSVEAMLSEISLQVRGNPQEMASYLGDARIEGAPWREHFATQQDYADALGEYAKLLETDDELREKQYNLLADKFGDSATTYKKVNNWNDYGSWYINHETGELEWDDYVEVVKPEDSEKCEVTFPDGTTLEIGHCGQNQTAHEHVPQYEEPYVPPVEEEPYYPPAAAQVPYTPEPQPQEAPEPAPAPEPEQPAPEPEPLPPPPAPPTPELPIPEPPVSEPPVPQYPQPDKGDRSPTNPYSGPSGPQERMPEPVVVPTAPVTPRIPSTPDAPSAPPLSVPGRAESGETPGGASGSVPNATDPNPTR